MKTDQFIDRCLWQPKLAIALLIGAGLVFTAGCSATRSAENRPVSREYVTGSYIPREIKKNGTITDAPYPVEIIDQETIERSSASTVADLLGKRVPSLRRR